MGGRERGTRGGDALERVHGRRSSRARWHAGCNRSNERMKARLRDDQRAQGLLP